MIFEHHNSPWSHLTIRNIFSLTEYDKIYRFARTTARYNSAVPVNNQGMNIAKRSIQSNFVDLYDASPVVAEICSGVFMETLLELGVKSPRREQMTFMWDQCPPDYMYPVHPDATIKACSMIVYLGEEGRGTILHETMEGPPVKEIDFQPNTALAFRRTDTSWHSMDMRGCTSDRWSLNMVYLQAEPSQRPNVNKLDITHPVEYNK